VERLRQQLELWLPEQFPQAEIILDPARPGQKIGGILAWEGFAGLEPIDRQGLLWRALRTRFNRDDQLSISSIITLTPAEYAVYREPQMA
jgi:hypothetical protein